MKELSSLLRYDNGTLFWLANVGTRARSGNIAGTTDNNGYTAIGYKRKLYLAHRIIYFKHYGSLPKNIDHIDGNASNNKIENLRACSAAENQHNAKKPKHNTSGEKGLVFKKDRNTWYGQVKLNKKTYLTKTFKSKSIARATLHELRYRLHMEFSNNG